MANQLLFFGMAVLIWLKLEKIVSGQSGEIPDGTQVKVVKRLLVFLRLATLDAGHTFIDLHRRIKI